MLVLDGDIPVLRYNAQTVPVPEGVTGKYAVARSGYIHPLFGPDGSVLTADYTKDHPHHRGIYWAWPEVTYKGKKHDLHALQGVFSRPEKVVHSEADGNEATIEASNRWLWENKTPIVRETVRIDVHAASPEMRVIDLAFRYEALEPGVTIARRGRHAYGGLNVRLSARKQQQIVTHTGQPRFPAAPAWGEVIGIPPGGAGRVGVFILQHPGNVAYPEDWVQYANLNWLQPAFPAKGTAYELLPGDPLALQYRIIVRMGGALAIPYAELWESYGSDWKPFDKLKSYAFGHDTAYLRKWERIIRTCPAAERAKAEPGLLQLLAASSTRDELKTWVCAQLKLAGSRTSVPALLATLRRPALMAPACQALEVIPGEAVDQALREAFPNLTPEAKTHVIAVMAARRDLQAIDLLTAAANGNHAEVSAAAVLALGVLGSTGALQALLGLRGDHQESAAWLDAELHCVRALVGNAEVVPKEARDVLRHVLATESAVQHQRAALAILAQIVPEEAMQTALNWLAQGPAVKQRASATALSFLPDDVLVAVLVPALPGLPGPARRIALEELVRRPGSHVRDAAVDLLSDPDCSETAARALGRVGNAADVPALARISLARGDAAATAREALLAVQGEGINDAIRDLLRAEDAAMRRLGADLLTARLAQASVSDMLKLMADPNRKVARQAFAALSDYGGPGEAAVIISQLEHLSPVNRAGAYRALAAIGKRGSIDAVLDPLLEAVRRNMELHREVVGVLHYFPSATSAGVLATTVGLTEAELVEAAARALLKWPTLPTKELLAAARKALADAPQGKQKLILRKACEHLALLATVNLCKGREVTSSHPWQGSWTPDLAVDGKVAKDSFWSCAFSPSSITVDLEAVTTMAALRVVNYWDGTRFYQYTAELSLDGKDWQVVADMSTNTEPATERGNLHTFERTDARFVRVTMLKNSANPGMHIAELQAFSSVPEKE